MFSPTDVQDLVRLFEPKRVLDEKVQDGHTSPISLLPSQSGKGFLVSNKVAHKLENKIAEETERIDVLAVSQELDVSDATVLRILPPHTLFSRDKRHIIPASEAREMLQQLLDYASRGLVIKSIFSDDNDISPEGVDVFLAGEDERLLRLEHPQSRSIYLTAATYQSSLDNEILSALQCIQNETRFTDLKSEHFLGAPPLWYIYQRAHNLSTRVSNLRGRIQLTEFAVVYQPETYLVRVRDYTLDQLRTGAISHTDLAQFVESLPELYRDVSGVQAYFKQSLGDGVSFASQYAVSNGWLGANRTNELQKFVVYGYTDVSVAIKANFPEGVQAEILASETERVISSIEGLPNGKNVSSVKQFLVREDYLKKLVDFILNAAREQARTQWTRLEQDLGQDCSLLESDVYEKFSRDEKNQDRVEVLKAVFEKNEGQAKAAFAEQVADLELQNETEFALFWSDRVAARFYVHRTGADAIAEPKLRSQLLELLQSHVSKELIPESLARAQTKGLIRSKKTKKNTQKFMTAIKSASDLPAISSSLDKLARKQGIEAPAAEALAEKKSSQLKELIRGMKKDIDGPRLFLTLMVVLLANRQAGIVYATGKFAPKLMKLLKESLGSAEYEQLEKWKDAVKAGSLSAEDKEQMRALAVAE